MGTKPNNHTQEAIANNDLSVDEGIMAFRNRVSDNPYPPSDWKHSEWQFGWDTEEQVNPELYDHAAEKFKI
jgi:hypothetical protein